MKISQIKLKGVNNFADFSGSFEDDWTGQTLDSILLIGPNGSGKTTVLRSIATLWEILGRFFAQSSTYPFTKNLLFPCPDCSLMAMQIRAFLPESEPLWICLGDPAEIQPLLAPYQAAHRFVLIPLDFFEQDQAEAVQGEIIKITSGIYLQKHLPPGASFDLAVSLSEQQWLTAMRERLMENQLGGRGDLPNIVFFESENRTLLPIEDGETNVREDLSYRWLARYEPTAARQGNIQNFLLNLKVVDEAAYQQIVSEVNDFLVDKRISHFDRRTQELMVETTSGQTHPVHLLSSGEKQILLMLAYISRELRPGGVVLIDEPDLHLHVSLRNAFVSHLKRMAARQQGQLIVASHAPDLWERFFQAEQIRLGTATPIAS